MTIGIIGAGIAGLVAGKMLAEAGHEVVVFEKSKGYGGRLATRYIHDDQTLKMDHGSSYLTANTPEFATFLEDLATKGILKKWTDNISLHNGETLMIEHPGRPSTPHYISEDGLNSLGKYLSRFVEVRTNGKVSGITFIGNNPQKKKKWMINLLSFNVFEVDALIIATPGVQAYGILGTSQNETAVRSLISDLDVIQYEPTMTVLAGYKGAEIPEWKGISCTNETLRFISNESSKRNTGTELALTLQSTHEFARINLKTDHQFIANALVKEAGNLVGGWAAKPQWVQVHLWKYDEPKISIPKPYMELENHSAPLALVGDYFQGKGAEAAYLSGYRLAQHWIKKFAAVKSRQ